MAKILTGKEVANEIKENIKERVSKLVESGMRPTLAIIAHVDEKEESNSYMKSIMKQASEVGINVMPLYYNTIEELANCIILACTSNIIHGCIVMRPLPECITKDIDTDEPVIFIDIRKDIDGVTKESLANIFVNSSKGYAPATAEACIRILDYYDIPIEGKNVTVIGRSLVVGKPLAMMLLNRNATVTICHSKTYDISTFICNSDIVISATGNRNSYYDWSFNPEHTVIDVGINFDENGKICGDVDFAEVSEIVEAITPAPGGVGSVTTAVLLEHVVNAAEKASKHV